MIEIGVISFICMVKICYMQQQINGIDVLKELELPLSDYYMLNNIR